MGRKLTNVEFIEKSKEIHNTKYDYSKSKYTGSHNKIEIICLEHGSFWQKPNNHLQGQNCPKCVKNFKIDLDIFVERANEKHSNRYNYNQSNYINDRTKTEIICKKHNSFWQTPNNHLKGHGCPKCASDEFIKNRVYNLEYFIKKSKEKHDNLYDYSKTIYTKSYEKLKIICKEHGIFEQSATYHLQGGRCPKCVGNSPLTTEEFIERSVLKHGDKYQYNNSKFITSNHNIKIICKFHGIFKQRPHNHMNGHGCPKCSHFISKPEIEVSDFVKSLNLEILTSKRSIIKPYELDIFIPSLNKAIEFNGYYWHYDHSNKNCKPRGYHAMKSNLCKEKGIKLLHIREDLWKNKKERMKEVIIQFLNN